jgi:uncharacterized protein (DUF58 family)
MMYPTRLLILAVALPALASLLMLVGGVDGYVLVAADLTLAAVALLDAITGWRRARLLQAEVTTRGTWSLSRKETIAVTLAWRGRRPVVLELAPDVPATIRIPDLPAHETMAGISRLELAFQATPSERGTWQLRGIHVALPSLLGLWRRHVLLGETRTVHTYPNLKQLSDYALLARTDRLALIGVRRSRRVGGDTEFERLRDYHSDDALNRMDWKATARRDALTVRDYQTNQSQRVLLLVDAGRMLTSTAAGADGVTRSLLDHAIDAALLLAWVAARQNDTVGLLAYADGIKRWVPPRGGPRQVTAIIHALHDLQADMVESRHEEAFLLLERRERKRSLVIVLTHVMDDVNADHLERHARLVSGRHLPLFVLLRDPDLHGAVPSPDHVPEDAAQFWRAGAAATLVQWRAGVIDRLRAAGALVIDCEAGQLSAAVVSRYLEVKARHLL